MFVISITQFHVSVFDGPDVRPGTLLSDNEREESSGQICNEAFHSYGPRGTCPSPLAVLGLCSIKC